MNPRQKAVLFFGAIGLALMLAFPPFIVSGRGHNLGFAFIFTPPAYYGNIGSVNVALLGLELMACIAITVLFVYFFKD